jgi:prepilin-type N-terminal cleavage/methylation domain-containing protein
MVLTNTYIRRRRSGFSLVELLVTLAVTVLIIVVGAAASENFLRAVAFLTNSVDLDAKNRLAIDRMSREIRGCDAVVDAVSTNRLVLRSGTNLIAFEYEPEKRELIRDHPDTGTEVYLKGCDYIRFDLFRRNPLGGPYDNYPTATTTNCKIVQINWVCSRRLLGFKANTGRMESARVVIRNQQD